METMAQQHAGADRMSTFPLYQVLAEDITAMGVEAAFGLMSDDTALLVTALDTAGEYQTGSYTVEHMVDHCHRRLHHHRHSTECETTECLKTVRCGRHRTLARASNTARPRAQPALSVMSDWLSRGTNTTRRWD